MFRVRGQFGLGVSFSVRIHVGVPVLFKVRFCFRFSFVCLFVWSIFPVQILPFRNSHIHSEGGKDADSSLLLQQ